MDKTSLSKVYESKIKTAKELADIIEPFPREKR